MKVYHITKANNAASILADGFRDSSRHYLTDEVHTGVWVSDSPLLADSGFADAVCFELEIAEELIRDQEWIEEGKGHREWLVPAAVLNEYVRRQLSEDELSALS